LFHHRREALNFTAMGRPGKLEIIATKPMATQRDLSLAYSPGVAVPVLAIAADPRLAYDYTAKGNWSPSSPTAPRSSAWAISARWPPSR
jgi:malic enzyme